MVLPEMNRTQLPLSLGNLAAASPLAMLQGVVRSRSGIDFVARKTNVSRRELERVLQVQSDAASNQLQITASHPDKPVAIAIVQATIEGLGALNKDIGFTTASKQVAYLRGTIAARERELRDRQAALVAFQKTLVAPIDPENLESAGAPLVQLRTAEFELGSIQKSLAVARRTSAKTAAASGNIPTNIPSVNRAREIVLRAENELRVLRIQLGDEAADVVQKVQELAIARDALRAEIARYLQSVRTNIDPRLAELEARREVTQDQIRRLRPIVAEIPGQTVEFTRLYTEARGAAAIVQTLREQYERARTEAEVERVRWSVLDRPYLEDKPNNKNYIRNVALGAVVGTLLGSFWALRRRSKL